MQLNSPRISVANRSQSKLICEKRSTDQKRTLRTVPTTVNKIHVVAEPEPKKFKKD